ncbi:MAG: FkbM family methyltransferase, partial [Nitrososphaerales archaeon]
SGVDKLYLIESGSGNFISTVSSSGAHCENCLTETIETLISKYGIKRIDFLKLDVEGAEFLLFERTDWLSIVRRVVMEVHPTLGSLSRIISILKNRGFAIEITNATYLNF